MRNPGGVRTKGREKLPSSCLPRPLPSPAPSSFKPRLARVVSVQSRPPPSEEMAEEPEPQVKGARPRPRRAPGAPRFALRRPHPSRPRVSVLLILPPPRMIAPPDRPFPLDSVPLGRPLPTRREGVGRAPGVYSVLPSHSLGNSRDGLGVEESPLSGSGAGPAGGSLGLRTRVRGGFPEKLDGSAGRVSRFADSVPLGGPGWAGQVGNGQNNAS